jgi:hypothetical protein
MKNYIKIFIGVILGFLLAYLILPEKTKEVSVEKPIYIQDLKTIHSLENEIEIKNNEISKLKNHIQDVKEVVIVEKEEIKRLPPDTGVMKLKEFLEIYTDTQCCSVYPTLNSDSLILLDSNNLKDINSVFVDYFGSTEIIFDQGEIIYRDSVIISNFDSINKLNTGIRENLELSLSREKKKKNVWMGIGIGTTITAILIGVLSYGRSGN